MISKNTRLAVISSFLVCVATIGTHWYDKTKSLSLTATEKQHIAEYVAKTYGVSKTSSLNVYDFPVDGSSMRRVEIVSSEMPQPVYGFVTLDRHYLISGINDLREAPMVVGSGLKALEKGIQQEIASRSAPSIGPADAAVTIVEFSDFRCPYCKRFSETALKQLLTDHPGSVRVVFRNFPLPIHSTAEPEAELAACVAQQNVDAFWKFHDFLFAQQSQLKETNLLSLSMKFLKTNASLNLSAVYKCFKSGDGHNLVANDVALGKRVDIQATPTFFLNGAPVEGLVEASALEEAVTKQKELLVASQAQSTNLRTQ